MFSKRRVSYSKSIQQRLSSDCTDVQADLSLGLVHMTDQRHFLSLFTVVLIEKAKKHISTVFTLGIGTP